MRVVLLAAGLSLAAPLSRWSQDAAADPGLLWIDTDQGPRAGADNMLFLHGAFGRLEDRLLPVRILVREQGLARAGNIAWRLGKAVLVDQAAAAWLPVLQHEVYGHGWRAREAGYGDLAYEIDPPQPYGFGEGSTSWSYAPSQAPGPDGEIGMASAGIEATDILARRLRFRWVSEGRMDCRSAHLYLTSFAGLHSYLRATEDGDTALSNDVVAWLTHVNGKAGRADRADWSVTRSGLEGPARWAGYLDVFALYSGFGILTHLWNGETRWKIRMIPLGNGMRWLPVPGYRLSPFGGQWSLENLVAGRRRTWVVRGASGGGPLGASLAADVEAGDLLAWRGLVFDAALRGWIQPRLWLDPRAPAPARASLPGGAFEVAALSPPLSASLPLRVSLGYGYKGPGWSPGLPLEAGSTVRAGVGLQR